MLTELCNKHAQLRSSQLKAEALYSLPQIVQRKLSRWILYLRPAYLQAVKAARRQEDIAVCVVQLLPSDHAPESDSQYLLVQRPDRGLLAGLTALLLLRCSHLLQRSSCMQLNQHVKYIHFCSLTPVSLQVVWSLQACGSSLAGRLTPLLHLTGLC